MKKKENVKEELEKYVEVINKLDAFRALRLWDPRPIEQIVKTSSSSDLRQAYKNIKSTLYKIAYYPAEVPELRKRLKILAVLKFLSIICLVFIAITLVISTISPALLEKVFGSFLATIAVNAVLLIVINVSMIAEYRLRKGLAEFYESKSLSLKKERIKNVVQFLIDRLCERIKKLGLNPEDYALSPCHLDYRNIKVIRKTRRKIIVIPDVKK